MTKDPFEHYEPYPAYSFDHWFDVNLKDENPHEILELYESVKAGKSTGGIWTISWDGNIMLIDGEEPDQLPIHNDNSKDCFLHMMEQRWGENNGEQGLRDWVNEQLSEDLGGNLDQRT